MFGPSVWVIFWIREETIRIHFAPRSEIDCTVTSWIGEGPS